MKYFFLVLLAVFAQTSLQAMQENSASDEPAQTECDICHESIEDAMLLCDNRGCDQHASCTKCIAGFFINKIKGGHELKCPRCSRVLSEDRIFERARNTAPVLLKKMCTEVKSAGLERQMIAQSYATALTYQAEFLKINKEGDCAACLWKGLLAAFWATVATAGFWNLFEFKLTSPTTFSLGISPLSIGTGLVKNFLFVVPCAAPVFFALRYKMHASTQTYLQRHYDLSLRYGQPELAEKIDEIRKDHKMLVRLNEVVAPTLFGLAGAMLAARLTNNSVWSTAGGTALGGTVGLGLGAGLNEYFCFKKITR